MIVFVMIIFELLYLYMLLLQFILKLTKDYITIDYFEYGQFLSM